MHWLDEYSILFFDKLDSTSLEAKRLIARGVKGKHVIVAAEQSLGQGRRGNSWYSPEGNLYFSIALDHKHDLAKLSQISLVTSLSCFEVVQELGEASEPSLFPRSFKIKWPNDLLLNGKKFCGILLQAFSHMDVASGEIANYLVIGIGINLISSPVNQAYPTTSLKEEGVRYGSIKQVLHRLMERFDKNYKLWQKKGFSDIRARWIQNAHNLGAKAQIKLDGERISGLFKDIDEEGQMILETESGVLRKVITCDVQFG